MNNWIFAICMFGVAIVLSMVGTFLKQILRILKGRRQVELEWITVTNAEYLDKDFLGRKFDNTKEKVNENNGVKK
ncbi:hypothetical protein CON22_17880 [Bacillus cereus]|nr:hypothetical protein CON22_17880 [Bacillus cereus]